MSNGTRLTNSKIAAALRSARGNLSAASSELGLTRNVLAEAVESTPALQDLCRELEETRLDYVEGKLLEMIDEKEFRAITYFLNERGRSRGYGVDGSESEDKIINVISAIPRPDGPTDFTMEGGRYEPPR